MSPPVSKDVILDAAEAIVCQAGAAHLTLDSVAARAQVSKGGLMYHFRSKEALLQGMIARLIDNIEALRGQMRHDFGQTEPTELMVEIKTLSNLSEMESRHTAALLAVIANQPDLMEPFREEQSRRFADRILSEPNPERATILFFAAMGLHFAELLNIPFLDHNQRKVVFADLLRLAANTRDHL